MLLVPMKISWALWLLMSFHMLFWAIRYAELAFQYLSLILIDVTRAKNCPIIKWSMCSVGERRHRSNDEFFFPSYFWCFLHLDGVAKWLDCVCNIISRLKKRNDSRINRFAVTFLFEKFITLTSRLPYSRQLEEEADEIGLILAAKVRRAHLENEWRITVLLVGLFWCSWIGQFLAIR